MQIDIIPFNESLTEFGFKPSEINAINLRIHTHIIPQLESIQVEAKVSDDFGDIKNKLWTFYIAGTILGSGIDRNELDKYNIGGLSSPKSIFDKIYEYEIKSQNSR